MRIKLTKEDNFKLQDTLELLEKLKYKYNQDDDIIKLVVNLRALHRVVYLEPVAEKMEWCYDKKEI